MSDATHFHDSLLEEQVRRARSVDGRFKVINIQLRINAMLSNLQNCPRMARRARRIFMFT